MRWFQRSWLGSQTSMPMPSEVERAAAGPGLPGPTLSLTRHRSAARVTAEAESETKTLSPCLKRCTATTLVSASGWKADFRPSSQASAGPGLAAAAIGAMPVAQPDSRATLARLKASAAHAGLRSGFMGCVLMRISWFKVR